jgi:hypothetical protein
MFLDLSRKLRRPETEAWDIVAFGGVFGSVFSILLNLQKVSGLDGHYLVVPGCIMSFMTISF